MQLVIKKELTFRKGLFPKCKNLINLNLNELKTD